MTHPSLDVAPGDQSSADLYVDLLKRCILNLIYEDPPIRNLVHEPITPETPFEGVYSRFNRQRRLDGQDWPSVGHTMIGIHRLDNLETLVKDILARQIPGDLIETGVWRGGGTIFMRGLLKAYGVSDRTVWVADSFEWFPSPNQVSERTFSSPELTSIRQGPPPETVQTILDHVKERTDCDSVREHFARYGLLDDQVQFLQGWFCDTLPAAPIERLALLRLDGDLYDSTQDALKALYHKVSPGGYVVVDDYGVFVECRQAIHDYLDSIGETVDIQPIDKEAVFWQKP